MVKALRYIVYFVSTTETHNGKLSNWNNRSDGKNAMLLWFILFSKRKHLINRIFESKMAVIFLQDHFYQASS